MACEIEELAEWVAANKDPQWIDKKVRERAREDKQYDVYVDAATNPGKYAEGIVASTNNMLTKMVYVFGKGTYDALSPTIKEQHKKAINKYSVYRDTVSMIRTGFAKIEFFEQMKETLNVASDTDQTKLNSLLQIGDDINQRMADYLTNNLPELDKRVQAKYKSKEDRKRLYKIFARSGISGLSYDEDIAKGVLDGTMTIDEAIASIEDESEGKVEKVAKYYVTGEMSSGMSNLRKAGLYDNKYKVLVALKALAMIDGSQEMLNSMDKDLKKELYGMTIAIEALHKEVYEQQRDYQGSIETDYNDDFDGNYMMDLYDSAYEYEMVSVRDMKTSKYTADDDWITLKEPKGSDFGIVARKSLTPGNVPGIGLDKNTFKNGFYVTGNNLVKIKNILNSMDSETKKKEYLNRNNMVKDKDGSYRVLIDEKTKEDKLDGIQSVAHSLWRTWVHNAELVQTQAVRDMVVDNAIDKVMDKNDMQKVVDDVRQGNELPMFLSIKYDYKSYEDLPKEIRLKYKTPENITSYNGLNKEITLVKKGVAHMLLGHKNATMFHPDKNRGMAKFESGVKQFIVMAKQKMVILSPSKLAVDAVSNVGILAAKDVSIFEMKDYMKKGFDSYNEFSKLRGELVQEQMKKMMGKPHRVDAIERQMEEHDFYDAFKAGFIQSYSTSLTVQEFDTISGLQKNINDIIEKITTNSKSEYNEIQRAIKWWQKLGADKGLTVDHLLEAASKKSMLEGTKVGEELLNMSKRLKSKKDVDSVAEYVNDIIGGPSSEAMKIGSGVMISIDIVSKYTLAKSLEKRTNPKTGVKYTTAEAYAEANESFIDYRRNMPPAVKALSDVGILMFPGFWMKAQKVIAGMIYYHPATALGGFAVAEYLDIGSSNFIDVNVISRVMDGRVLNDPTSLIDADAVSWLF